GGGGVGQPGQVEVVELVGGLSGQVGQGAAQGLQVADGLGAGGAAVVHGGGGGHGEDFGVALAAVVAQQESGSGGPVGAAVPAGVDPHLVGRVLVHQVADVPGRGRHLGRPAQVVHLGLGLQVQATPARGAPTARQAGEVAGLVGVHVSDGLDHP